MPILVTGTAGFIGSAVTLQLLSLGREVVGVDNLNDYYDVSLKNDRLQRYASHPQFSFYPIDITDRKAVTELFSYYSFDVVIHLAAQPGVRYSLINPYAYIDSNLVGFANMIEECRKHHIKHFIFASSSSVYGANPKLPFSEHDAADHPISLYAATKRANELMAHSYAHGGLPCTGLRFFTVYGPWCRPDMALFSFTNDILQGKPIKVFNQGNMMRDFTYIDDIVSGVISIMDQIPQKSLSTSLSPASSPSAPYRIYNIGNHQSIELKRYIQLLEQCLNKKALLEMLPMQAGDVLHTYADIHDIENLIGELPHTPLEVGIAKFVEWYKDYYQVDAQCARLSA